MLEACVGAEMRQPGPGADGSVDAFARSVGLAGLGYPGGAYAYPYAACGMDVPPGLPNGFYDPQCAAWDSRITWGGHLAQWDQSGQKALVPGLVESGRPRQQGNGRKKKQDASGGHARKNHELASQEPPWVDVTTVMMRNLPNKYTQQKLLDELQTNGFEPLRDFDFFYLPMDHCTAVNLGYCFINFVDPSCANTFASVFQGKRMQRFNSSKTIQVMPASIQGFERNFAYYASRRVAQDEDPQYRPLFLRSPAFMEASHMATGVPPPGVQELMGKDWGMAIAATQLCSTVPSFPSGVFEAPHSPGALGSSIASLDGAVASSALASPDFPHQAGDLHFESPGHQSPVAGSTNEPMKLTPLSTLEHEMLNNMTEAATAPFTFHAAMLGIDLQGHQDMPTGTSKEVRRFVLARATITSAGSGYIGLQAGEELVVLHSEGEWYYGFVLLDPQRQGWFPRSQVVADHVGSPTSPPTSPVASSLPHLLLRGSKFPTAAMTRPGVSVGSDAGQAKVGVSSQCDQANERPASGVEGERARASGVELPASMEAQPAVRRFVKASVAFESAGTGYLSAKEDEELIALHSEGAWYYGLALLDPLRQGWFCRDLVTL